MTGRNAVDLDTEAVIADRLTEFRAFGTALVYRAIGTEDFRLARIAELGEFIDTVIAGIYAGIRAGAFNNPGDYAEAPGRPHQSWRDCFAGLRFGTGC